MTNVERLRKTARDNFSIERAVKALRNEGVGPCVFCVKEKNTCDKKCDEGIKQWLMTEEERWTKEDAFYAAQRNG